MKVPHWLPPGRVVSVPERGEVFVRQHQHADPAAPVVLLLHGWTASADTQFLYAYERLAERYSIVGVDHHGHGRGRRGRDPFDLALVADDAAAATKALGIDTVIAVGYSMGGPISMYLAQRHPDLVRGLVLQATALEWRSGRFERFRWHFVPLMAPVTRAWWFARNVGRGLRVVAHHNYGIREYLPWLSAEILRNDPMTVVSAGRALSHHDARPWAGALGIPAASVITAHDHLVPARKQRALAQAMRAEVFEVPSGHLGALSHPAEFAHATRAAVDHVVTLLGSSAG